MIIVRLMGGLGNQMFQYALGKRLALLHNTELKADLTFLNKSTYSHTPRKFALNVFNVDIPLATENDVKKFEDSTNSKFRKGVQKLFPFILPYNLITEIQKTYDKKILNAPKNSLIVGYWQTEKYFLPIRDILFQDFSFKKHLTGNNLKLADEIKLTNSVSMHVRRGDYISNKEASLVHSSCSPDYYYSAINYIKSKYEDIHLYIFSDDINWIKQNMEFNIPVTFIENNSGENSYIDMQLMSLCKHNIIANSSFSWWAAWLNNNIGKIVVAPAKWFNDLSVDTNDLIPAGWEKM